MLRTFASHIRNQWAGFLSLFLVLTGGVAYAANTIGSTDVIDESLLSQDVKNGEVKNTDLAPNSVSTGKILNGEVRTIDVLNNDLTGADIANSDSLGSLEIGGLGGADIDESTLGQVPSAGSVANVTIVERVGNAVTFGDQNANNGVWVSGTSQAQCLPGETVVGGGGNWANGQQAADEALAITENSLNGTTNTWHATAISDADNDTFRAHVLCFQGG